MIYLSLKHIKVSKENKKKFFKLVEEFIKKTKREELNLSIEGFWKDENNFLIVERWSTEETYNAFIKKADYLAFLEALTPLTEMKIKILKYTSVC